MLPPPTKRSASETPGLLPRVARRTLPPFSCVIHQSLNDALQHSLQRRDQWST